MWSVVLEKYVFKALAKQVTAYRTRIAREEKFARTTLARLAPETKSVGLENSVKKGPA